MAKINGLGRDDNHIDRLLGGDTWYPDNWDGSHPSPAPSLPRRALTPEQKRVVMERVLQAWCEVPELRLGQMLDAATGTRWNADLSFIEDRDLVELLESWRK